MQLGQGDFGDSWRSLLGSFAPTTADNPNPNPNGKPNGDLIKSTALHFDLNLAPKPSTGPSSPSTALKRARRSDTLASDREDEEELLPRKRRRLRFGLVTSMLSRPYALPPTHVPARRGPRDGMWARQRVAGRDLLRKAAIFNTIAMKRRTSGMRGINHRRLTRRAALIESCSPNTRPRSRSRSPHARASAANSPLDPSPAAASDNEDLDDYEPFDAFESTDVSDDEDDKSPDIIVYSDFNSLRNNNNNSNADGDADTDLADEGYSFDSFDTGQTLTFEASEKVMLLMREGEKMSEVSLAPGLFPFERKRPALVV